MTRSLITGNAFSGYTVMGCRAAASPCASCTSGAVFRSLPPSTSRTSRPCSSSARRGRALDGPGSSASRRARPCLRSAALGNPPPARSSRSPRNTRKVASAISNPPAALPPLRPLLLRRLYCPQTISASTLPAFPRARHFEQRHRVALLHDHLILLAPRVFGLREIEAAVRAAAFRARQRRVACRLRKPSACSADRCERCQPGLNRREPSTRILLRARPSVSQVRPAPAADPRRCGKFRPGSASPPANRGESCRDFRRSVRFKRREHLALGRFDLRRVERRRREFSSHPAAAANPARRPNTSKSESELPPRRFAPCNPPAASPAAKSPGTDACPVSASTRIPPIT